MAKVIGANLSDNRGENLFVNKAVEYLADDAIIYRNRQIFGKEFDACVLLPRKGILVVEVKGWREKSVLRVDSDNAIVIRAGDGEVKSNPQKQARGYRFALENFIRQGAGLRPLVVQMVSLPQISANFFKECRLDTVLEESFTLLKEDFSDKAAFYRKINEALAYASQWNRDAFSEMAMLKVRGLFEAEIDGGEQDKAEPPAPVSNCRRDYSRFYYVPSDDETLERTVSEMTGQYLSGCKLYCVFSSAKQLSLALSALDAALMKKGIRRNGENLENAFDEEIRHSPEYSGQGGITGFHFSFSLIHQNRGVPHAPLCVMNGDCSDEERMFLTFLSENSVFNAEQYFVEHADSDKNIMIRAGAGTGKTYAMISRIAYICYTQNAPLEDMAERILMITFTNEAAEQMASKLKAYFRNLCVLCANQPWSRECLMMIAHIDQMQISTIHSYAKTLMSQLGSEFGYGIDLNVTSSEYQRRQKVIACIDEHIRDKRREKGRDYMASLHMPVYEIRDNILDFIGKLRNQSVNISALEAANFGTIPENSSFREFHELLVHVIPTVEREYEQELLENNKIHLGALMSFLHRAAHSPSGLAKLREMGQDCRQFLFVDEFQDTDDVQIDILLKIASALNYRMFLVGDIKQCIYRFRGAEEKAFDRVGAAEHPDDWLQFSLRRNYRTDSMLLDMFDKSFTRWNAQENALLEYRRDVDRLIGTRDYNRYLAKYTDKFYRCLSIRREGERIPALMEEIRRIQRRIQYETEQGRTLSAKEKSVAILVRENWQAELIRSECAKQNIMVETNTGGDLYASQPALDMLTLVNALVHFDEADYLYAALRSNFFRVNFPKSHLYHIRAQIRNGEWRNQAQEKDIANRLMKMMSPSLSQLPGHGQDTKWEYLIQRLRVDPVLQIMREIYNALEPWKKYAGDDLRKQHEYQLNVDLLFEQIINACNIDRLTVNTLREHLFSCVISHASVESRRPPEQADEIPIQCVTVHKAKGLEYGHVILPYASFRMDYVKPSRLHVNAAQTPGGVQIGYSLSIGKDVLQNNYYDPKAEETEKTREEARILYVAMTRAIRSFSWIELQCRKNLCWQNLIEKEV